MAKTASRSHLVDDPAQALELIGNVLEASTEYSMIGKDLDGKIVLWNEGARRLYGYDADEVLGGESAILHTAEDVSSGRAREILDVALSDGKWEGVVDRVRKDGTTFVARVVVTPRVDAAGTPLGFLLMSKDISNELRLNRELEATQFYTRSLIESNVDALMTTDSLGLITDVNEEMARLTGRPREELIGSPFKDYFTDTARAEEGIRLVLRDTKVTNYELTARAKDGRNTVVSYNASTFYDRDGKLQGVFAAARDITEQKTLEQQLRETQAYNRGLIESSVDGLITVDPEGLISDVNERMCLLSGYPREELIGTSFSEYFLDADRASDGVRETFTRGVVTDYVLALRVRDGGERQVSFNASVFEGPDGGIQGIFGSARDITEQAVLQRQLAEERAYNRGLIEASLDALITVDPLLVISDVNETMCRLTGYTREELIGSAFQDYFTDPKAASKGVRLTFDRGSASNYELTLRTRTGEERLVSFNAAVFKDEEDVVRGIFASARDVTEQAALQQQLADERAYNRGLIEASVDGLLTVDAEMTITDVNETMCRMAGRSRAQLIGSRFADHFSERELAERGVALTFEAGSVTNYVLTLVSATGAEVPVSFNAATFRDTNGEVRGVFASARDISEQKTLEERASDSQFYTRSLIESNVDALMTTDSLGVITDVNQEMEALTGSTREELIGSLFKDYFTDPKRAEDGIRRVLRDGKVTNYELTARAANGLETVVSYNASTFYDRDGSLQGVFAAARDVTEHKQLEQQLRESEKYNRGLIEASIDGLVTVDSDGFVSDVNERMCEMTGYTRGELVGTPFADYFSEPDRAREGVRQTFADGFVTEYALTLVSRTRRQLQVSFNASVFEGEDGAVRGIFASARDITDRVRLEEALREQQTYLRGLIESSVDGLVTVDPDGFITDVNEQLCRLTDARRDELVGTPFKDYFTDPELADRGVKLTFADGVVTNYDLALRSKSDRKTIVSFNASTYRGADGTTQGIFASARDTSGQARLQAQLEEQQSYNRSLIEASPDAQFAIAPDGVITDVNEEASRLTGYSRRHLVNSRFQEYFTDADLARRGVAETLDKGRVIGYELVLVTRHGRKVTVSFNAGVFTDSEGSPLGILALARDITAQRELEVQLRDSQLYTRSVIEANIDAMMATDPIGVITDVNQQMEALTRHTREELIGRRFREYVTEPERVDDAIRVAVREGSVTNVELTALDAGGGETVILFNAASFTDREGRLQGVVAAARDVTARKQGEVELQDANAELERANLSKDRFLASMSHELRTPLNSIIGFTGAMLLGYSGPLTNEQHKQVETVQASGKHLLSLINDLLDLAKVESGKLDLEPERLAAAEAVDEIVRTLGGLATEKGLLLTVAVPEDLHVRADRRALTQILLNLTSNAIKFTETGSIKISARRAPKSGRVVITVTDTGSGIPTEDQVKLFQAFEQGGSSATRRHDGTGLGLYISQKLATSLGGDIACQSTPGKGSRFMLTLEEA
ncbi:MAG: PAS domain S-box protein [Acidobacteriota bacterium]|nr:PAS domain S-box protein [Acidobacteriota bacterium]